MLLPFGCKEFMIEPIITKFIKLDLYIKGRMQLQETDIVLTVKFGILSI